MPFVDREYDQVIASASEGAYLDVPVYSLAQDYGQQFIVLLRTSIRAQYTLAVRRR